MRKTVAIGIIGVGLLAGCMTPEPMPFYLKTGSTPIQHNEAQLECEVTAAQSVPVSNQISTTPTFTTPISCSPGYGGYVTCSGGQKLGGNVVTNDANLDLRVRLETQCMANKGYTVRYLPNCTDIKTAGGRSYWYRDPQPNSADIICVTGSGFMVPN